MNVNWLLVLLFLFCFISCNKKQQESHVQARNCACDTTVATNTSHSFIRGALLGSRIKSLEELKSVIQVEYFDNHAGGDTAVHVNSKVCVKHCSNGMGVISELESGVSQGDIGNARNGDIWDRVHLIVNSPYAVANRMDLSKVYLLARRRADLFGEGDAAFYDLAEAAVRNINTHDLAFINLRDSTEKGFLNSFNHITAQAFITSCFSETLADFVGDTHERYYHPELITGKFSKKQIKDLDEGPLDNYVDVINNEWGQEVGKNLKKKYSISRETNWTPELLANYLNDLQSYYAWAFQIGFKPVRADDEVVIRFSSKLNLVLAGDVSFEKVLREKQSRF